MPEHQSLQDRLDWFLADLPPRSRLILLRRNGIGQQACETLEEIGAELCITRERVRQIESKALNELKRRARRAPIHSLLVQAAKSQWPELAGGTVRLLRSEIVAARRRMAPYVRLGCDVDDLSFERLLDLIAQPYPHGWLEEGVDAAAVERVAQLLPGYDAVPLPYPVQALDTACDLAILKLAAELIADRPIRYGYLMPERVGSRLTRMARLHCMLAEAHEPVSIDLLVNRYRALFADDPCSVRDAEIVMDAAPHLFLELCDGAWSAINVGGASFGPVHVPASLPASVQREDEGTIAAALRETLARRGPTRLADLMDESAAILPEGRSVNSIGPVLLMRPDLFVRALPGVYALPEQIRQFICDMPEGWPVLFNDNQARLYALARYAGEDRQIFPLWSANVERALCHWARHSGGPGVLSSLLAVADLASWGLDPVRHEEWSGLKRAAHFEAGSTLRLAAAYQRPEFGRLFAACRYAAGRDTMSWCTANRLTGRKLDSHAGAGVIALLLALGALEEYSHEGYRWQKPHRTTAVAQHLSDRFEDAFKLAIRPPDWDSPLGTDLIEEIRRTDHLGASWVRKDLLIDMFAADYQPAAPESDDPFEQLLEAQRHARDAERRQATLDWLLEE